MDKMVKINIRGTKGVISSHEVQSGENAALRIKVPLNGQFNIELADGYTGRAPQIVTTKRVGNDLVLVFERNDENTSDIILEGFYKTVDIHLIGKAENGQYYEFIPTSGEMADYTPVLTAGSVSQVVLGGEGSALADPVEIGDESHFTWLPWLLAFGGAAGLAAVALTTSGNDYDSESNRINVVIHEPTDNNNDGRPEFSGSSSGPYASVIIKLPDGSIVTTQADANGNWSIEVPSSQPDGTITVTLTDEEGNVGSASMDYKDTAAPDVPVVSENNNTILSGTAEPGSGITITDPTTGETTTTVADNQGNWKVSPNPLSEGSNVAIVAEDPAGNVSPSVIIERPPVAAEAGVGSVEEGQPHSTSFITGDAEAGNAILLWDDSNHLELGSVSSLTARSETINIESNTVQTLAIKINDVLEVTKADGEAEHSLHIVGENGNADKSLCFSETPQTQQNVNYGSYLHNDNAADSVINLMIQNGMSIV